MKFMFRLRFRKKVEYRHEENEWVKDMKRRGQKEHSKQGDEQNKFIHYNKTDIDTLKIVACVCAEIY